MIKILDKWLISLLQYRTECENQIQHHMNLLNKLKEDRSELVAYLDEEKRKTEDLTFRLAESSIFKEDAEVCNNYQYEINQILVFQYKIYLIEHSSFIMFPSFFHSNLQF